MTSHLTEVGKRRSCTGMPLIKIIFNEIIEDVAHSLRLEVPLEFTLHKALSLPFPKNYAQKGLSGIHRSRDHSAII
jgi:hypothetical protein